ncbi:hypothetical protein MUP79_06035 [Candidatus Bathyarchaeota archaeon]|jgi:hypothetical protein|nr:hypothetical protein [Candidatus Bathyarchaeota archaeon]
MGVKISCNGFWNGLSTCVEGDSVAEVEHAISELERRGRFEPTPRSESTESDKQVDDTGNYPSLSGDKGCTNAIRELLDSEWGKTEPRNENELTLAMKANAIHYSHGSISGVLTQLTQKGEIRRVGKKNGSYAYAISSRNVSKNPEHEVLVTAQ